MHMARQQYVHKAQAHHRCIVHKKLESQAHLTEQGQAQHGQAHCVDADDEDGEGGPCHIAQLQALIKVPVKMFKAAKKQQGEEREECGGWVRGEVARHGWTRVQDPKERREACPSLL